MYIKMQENQATSSGYQKFGMGKGKQVEILGIFRRYEMSGSFVSCLSYWQKKRLPKCVMKYYTVLAFGSTTKCMNYEYNAKMHRQELLNTKEEVFLMP